MTAPGPPAAPAELVGTPPQPGDGPRRARRPADPDPDDLDPDLDLVNAALLGTDRRPPDAAVADPAGALLDQAARRRARAQVVVGGERCPSPVRAPVASLPPPPVAARELLTELLQRPGALPVDLWLRAAEASGCGLAAEHWTPVLDLAARQPQVDRRRLGAALGERGRWFAGHNPAWARLLRATPEPRQDHPGREDEPATGVGVVDLDALVVDPDRVFVVPDPWPEPVVRAALDLLGSAALPSRAATAYGAAVGVRLPLPLHALVAEAVARHRVAPPAPRVRLPAWARPAATTTGTARPGLTAVEDVVALRRLLAQAFDPAPPAGPSPGAAPRPAAGPNR